MCMLKYRILTIVGISGLMATAAPVTAAAADPPAGSEEVEAATPETSDCDRAAAASNRHKSRVVYVGPRQNIRMRFRSEEEKAAATAPCEAKDDKVEVRTIYVGPRQNVPMKIVRKPADDD